ncbi:MAG: redoxin domain-containing protein [Anaerolineales bacterium]
MEEQSGNNLHRIEQLLHAGKKEEVLPLLAAYLQKYPNSAQGWWLLSLAVPDLKRQIDCLERVVQISPNNAPARNRLEKLKEKASFTSPPVSPFIESTSSDKSAVASNKALKQDSKPLTAPKPVDVEKKKSPVLRYALIVLGVCALLGFFGLGAKMLMQGRFSKQSAQPVSFTQISLPPTWTPVPTATRIVGTEVPLQPSATPLVPTVDINVSPTNPVPRSQIGPLNGYYAPDFSLTNINGDVTTNLSDYEGKAVIIIFWATWCPECKTEIPALQMIYQNYKDNGMTVLAVDVGENASLARMYRDSYLLTFPILDDASRIASSTYQVTALPTYFFVDPSGLISSINIGPVGYWGFDSKVKTMLNLP